MRLDAYHQGTAQKFYMKNVGSYSGKELCEALSKALPKAEGGALLLHSPVSRLGGDAY